jgi:two-component system nitrogen regulation sensor histidine kinase NtrY
VTGFTTFVLVLKKSIFWGWLLLALGVLLSGWASWQYRVSSGLQEPNLQLNTLQAFLQQREATADSFLRIFSTQPCASFSDLKAYPAALNQAATNAGIGVFRYDTENLLFWSDNTIPVGLTTLREGPNGALWKLKNGWYLARKISVKNCVLVALAQVRQEYSYQNDYLQDRFFPGSGLPAGARLSAEAETGALQLQAGEGKTPVWFVPDVEAGSAKHNLLLLLGLSGVALVILGGHALSTLLPVWFSLLWWLFLLALRWFSFRYNLPELLYATALFSPSEYGASNWLPSLGDLLLNVCFLFYSALLVHQKLPRLVIRYAAIATLPMLLFLFGYGWFTIDLLRGLIQNSSIPLDINDFLSLTTSSYAAFLVIGLLFSTYFIWIIVVVRQINRPEITALKLLITHVFAALLWMAIQHWLLGDSEWLIVLFSFLLPVGVYLSASGKSPYRYGAIIGLLALFSLVGTVFLQRYTAERELEKRKLLAVKISAEQDPIAESIFPEVEKRILSDTLLKSYLRPETQSNGPVRDLGQLFFNGYWEKYKINVHVFGADECLMTALYASTVKDPLVYDRLIDSIGIMTLSEHFFFLDNNSGRISYIARLPVYDEAPRDTELLGTLYIEFNSRYTPEEIGYPELLLDKMVSSNTDMSRYSYARYAKGALISHFGAFAYSLHDDDFRLPGNEQFSMVSIGGYHHLIHRPQSDALVVLSLPNPSLLRVLTPFSYLMLFFGLLALLPFGLRLLRRDWSGGVFSFKRRIQLSIVLILFLALLLIGGGTIFYIITNNNEKNYTNLSEKIHSVLIETEYIIGKDAFLDPAKSEDLAYALTRQANVFFADINVFTPSGLLFASSRPKVFDEGLVSRKMNAEAFHHLLTERSTEYVHKEQIGKLEYLSAYVPLRNTDNKVIGYLNLPYFARQSELRREIANFVVAIVNIYVLLIVLVLIAAIFLSNTITEPLRIIQERLGKLRLGRENEAIAWKGNDEIGALIAEYNRMVNALAESAEKLARSERETAWREMAKQVAHEIKNPLTPMKLSTQMLRRAWDDKAPGFEERLERFTRNLIEQIDTLSHIATEFGNFAKMPRMVKEPVNMAELLESTRDFHQGEGGVSIHLHGDLQRPCKVLTDKEQMLRVFNNLIRNAVQAIPEGRQGRIEIELNHEANHCLIGVRDNGSGIPNDLTDKIFYPNFTTKNAGMGLGLALVKNIVETSDGRVWFETKLGEGTVFYIRLPLIAEDF